LNQPPGREHLPALLGSLPALALFAAWAADDGGYEATTWYAGALGMLLLLVCVVGGLGGSRRRAVHVGVVVAVAGLAAYTGWSFLSITWAEIPGDALEGSNRTLLYLVIATVFVALPWTTDALRLALLGFVLAMGGLAIVTIIRVAGADDPLPYFANARLTAPFGYQNASPAGWTLAALPALVLSSRRETAWWLRAVLMGFTTVFVELALVSQSRTWLITLPLLFLTALVLTPSRLRLVLAATPVAAATGLASSKLLQVYNRGGGGPDDFREEAEIIRVIASTFDAAGTAILVSGLAVAAAGAAWAQVDRRTQFGAATYRRLRLGGAILAAAAAALALAVAVALAPEIGDVIDEFKRGTDPNESAAEGSRFGSLGTSRSDFWRVAVDLWEENPVAGLGQDNFAADYLQRADSNERPRWTHSLELRLLTHTGLVGLLLFVCFAGGIVMALWSARRALAPPGQAVLAAAALPLAVWLLAGSVDWFWEMPALSGPAIGFGLAAATLAPAPARRRRVPRLARTASAAAGACAVLLAALVLGAPWLSARHTERGLSELPDVAAARRHLDAALDLNPWSARPALALGFIAARLDEYPAAAAAFREVLERDPVNWTAELELGVLAALDGDDAGARRHLGRAARLHPRSDIVDAAREAFAKGERLDLAEINSDLAGADERLTAR
jgi:tetratricopeptide (TPR) repeat protein